MDEITPCLWFDGDAEEAAALYTSVFPGSRVVQVQRYGPAGPGPEGAVMVVAFELAGRPFVALNGGPQFTFSEAVSFQVPCDGQAEVDRYWEALSEGGERGPCGWLKDCFGVSWQVFPRRLIELIADPDPELSARVTEAMLAMGKIDLAELERAAAGA